MRVFRNYMWNVFYQFFLIVVPLVTIPYISRVLGPTGVGINSYTNSIVQYFILFGSVGVSFYGNRQIAFVRDDKKILSNTFWSIFFMRLLFIVMALFFYFIFSFHYVKYTGYLLIQSVLLLAAAFDISWFFMGIENFRVTVLRNIFIKLITLLSIFLLVKNSHDTGVYIFIIALSTLFGNLTLFPYLKREVSKPIWKNIDIMYHLVPSIALFIPQVAIQIYVVLNKTMLGQMISAEASGFYDSSDKIVRIILAIVTSTGTVLLPFIANKFANGKMDEVKHIFTLSFRFVSFVSIPLCFGLAAISDKFAILFLGQKFQIVGVLLLIEPIAALFISWDNAIGTQYLLPTKQNKIYTISVCVGAVVNIVFNIPLIHFFGVIGSMFATVLSEFSVTLCMIVFIRKQIKIIKLFSELQKYAIASIIMFGIVFLLDRNLSISWSSVSIEVLVGVLVYVVLMYLERPKIISQMLRLIRKK